MYASFCGFLLAPTTAIVLYFLRVSLGETVAVGAFVTDISDRDHVALKVKKGLEPML